MNQVFQVGVDSSIVVSSGVQTADFKIKASEDELGSLSFEDADDGTQYFSISKDNSSTLFSVTNPDTVSTVFSVSPSGNAEFAGIVTATKFSGVAGTAVSFDELVVSAGAAATLDVKIRAYTDNNGSISFENAVDATSIFTLRQDDSGILFDLAADSSGPVFVIDSSGNVGVKTDSIGASRALDVYGNVVIEGSITKGSGTFTIPHPIDSSRLLVHSFIEGPKADLIYRGKSQLSNGISTIIMDSHVGLITETWGALCRNPQVFLQNNESFALVKATITNDGILTITSNEDTNDTIDWMVVAERQDEVIKNAHWTDDDGNVILEPTK